MVCSLEDPDTVFYTLEAVKALALHENCLLECSRKAKRLFVWLQHNHILPTLWRVLDSAHSQVALLAVPLLLHSLALPHGADLLWTRLDAEFTSQDWRVRHTAVEKATLLFRFLAETPVKVAANNIGGSEAMTYNDFGNSDSNQNFKK